jgi:rhamnogalacturonyl hydrolase YesR
VSRVSVCFGFCPSPCYKQLTGSFWTASIEAAASYAAWGMMTWYAGNETGQIPGQLLDTWWEGGAMFMALMEYYHFTGDATYNDEIIAGMEWQSGDDGNYMPKNQTDYIVSLVSQRTEDLY